MPEKPKYIFRWKDGVEVRHTWDYSEEGTWDNALLLCRPAVLKRADRSEVMDYLRGYGEVVEMEAENV